MPAMIDMGRKGNGLETASPSNEKNRIYYPSLHLDTKVPPMLMDKDIGEMCRLEIVGKIVSKSINENDRTEGRRENMTIEVHKMGYVGKAGKLTKKEYLSKNEDEREEYDKEDVGVEEKE